MIYGVAVDLMDGNTDYESIDGSGETKRYAVSAYATYMAITEVIWMSSERWDACPMNML